MDEQTGFRHPEIDREKNFTVVRGGKRIKSFNCYYDACARARTEQAELWRRAAVPWAGDVMIENYGGTTVSPAPQATAQGSG